MLHSMTGFGAAHRNHGSRLLAVEAKSVNHRYCEVRFNLPRDLEGLLHRLEPLVRAQVRRGRVDVSVMVGFVADAAVEPAVDVARARGYFHAYRDLAEALEVPFQVSLATIAQCAGVMRPPDAKLDPESDFDTLAAAVREAVDQLIMMRRREGQQLGSMIKRHLDTVARLRAEIVGRLPEAVAERQSKLRKRVDDLLQERGVDEARIGQEVALLAERADVTEEVERLDSHIMQFRRLIVETEAVGRKLDFLIQEMNREANTIGSKCSDAAVAHVVVDLKAELERMREQVQNVE